MNTEYQETIEKSFKNIKLASLLIIIEMILVIVFTIVVMYIVISIMLIAISKNIVPGMIDSFILQSIWSNSYLILILGAFYICSVGFSVYSVYLFSRSISLLSLFNKSLKGPAKFSKYLYLIMLIIDASEGFYIALELNSLTNISVSIIFTVIGMGVFLVFLYLFIGIYRIGVIYNNSSIRMGAIFYFIPFLDIVAPFLLYSGGKKLLVTYKNE